MARRAEEAAALTLLVQAGLLGGDGAADGALFPVLIAFVRDQAIAALDRPKPAAPLTPPPTPPLPAPADAPRPYDADFPPLAARPSPAPAAAPGPKRVAPTKVHALCTKPEELAAQSANAPALRSLAALYASLFHGRQLAGLATELTILLRMLSLPLEMKRDPPPAAPLARLFSAGHDFVLFAAHALDCLAPALAAHGGRVARLCLDHVHVARFCPLVRRELERVRAQRSPRPVAPLAAAQRPEPDVTRGLEAGAEVRRGRGPEEQGVLANREKCRDAFLELLQQLYVTRELAAEAVRGAVQGVAPENWAWLAHFLVAHALRTDEADPYLLQLAGGAERLQRLNERMSAAKAKGGAEKSAAPERLREQRVRLLLAVAEAGANVVLHTLLVRAVLSKLHALLTFQSHGQLMHALTERVLQLRCLAHALGALLALPYRAAFPQPDAPLHAPALADALAAEAQLPPLLDVGAHLARARATHSLALHVGWICAYARALGEHPTGRRLPQFRALLPALHALLLDLPAAADAAFRPVHLLVALEWDRLAHAAQLDLAALPPPHAPPLPPPAALSASERVLRDADLDAGELVDGAFLEVCCPAVESLAALLSRLNERHLQMSGQGPRHSAPADPLRFSDGLSALARRKISPQPTAPPAAEPGASGFQRQLRHAFFAQHPELSRLADFALQAAVQAAQAEAQETVLAAHEERLAARAATLAPADAEHALQAAEAEAVSAVWGHARAVAGERIRSAVAALAPHGLEPSLQALTCALAIEHAAALLRERAAEACPRRLRAALQERVRRNAKASPTKVGLRSPKVPPSPSSPSSPPPAPFPALAPSPSPSPAAKSDAAPRAAPDAPLLALSVACTDADVATLAAQLEARLAQPAPPLLLVARALCDALGLLCPVPSVSVAPLTTLLARLAPADPRPFAALPAALLASAPAPRDSLTWRERVSAVLHALLDAALDTHHVDAPLMRLAASAPHELLAAQLLASCADRHLRLPSPAPLAFAASLALVAASAGAEASAVARAALARATGGAGAAWAR